MNTKKFMLTLIFGTLIFFIWNAVSWMILPFHANSLNNIPESAFDAKVLQSALAEDGVYHYPGYPENDAQETVIDIENKLKSGPRITMMVYKEGGSTLFDPLMFLWGFLINLITVLLAYYLVSGFGVRTTKTMVLACFFIGLTVVFVSDISLVNWYMFPWDYTMANIVDRLVPFVLLGLLFGGYTFKNLQKT